MKTNITLICLENEFNKKVAHALSNELELYYVDVADLMQFNLISIEDVLKKCGVNYLQKLEKDAIKSVAGYENTIITSPVNILLESQNIINLKNSSIIIYLRLTQKTIASMARKLEENKAKALQVDMLAYEQRDKYFMANSDIMVNIVSANTNSAIKKVIKAINQYYT